MELPFFNFTPSLPRKIFAATDDKSWTRGLSRDLCDLVSSPGRKEYILHLPLLSSKHALGDNSLSLSLSLSDDDDDGWRKRKMGRVDGSFEDLGTRVADETNGEHPADYARNDRAN